MAGELIQYQAEDGVTVIRLQAKVATQKDYAENDRWHARAINAPNPVEHYFVDAIGKVKQIEAAKPKAARKGKGNRA